MRGRVRAAFSFPLFPTYSRHIFLGYAVFSSTIVIRNKVENLTGYQLGGLFVTGIDLITLLFSTTSTVAINDVSRHSHNRSICTRHSFARNNFRRGDVERFARAFVSHSISYRLCFTRKESFFSFFCFSLTLHAIYAYIRVLLTNRFFPLHDYLNYVTIESIELRNHVSLFHCFIFFSWFFFFHK